MQFKRYALAVSIILGALLPARAAAQTVGFVYGLARPSFSPEPNSLYGVAVDATGQLIPLAGFPILTGGNGEPSGAEMVFYDTAAGRLYALNNVSNTVSAWSVNHTTGALTSLPFSPIALPAGFKGSCISVNPGGSVLVVGGGFFGNPGVASYRIGASTATPAAGSPFSTGTAAPFSCTFTRDGQFFYAGGSSGSVFAGFSVDQSTGILTPLAGSPFNTGVIYPVGYQTDSVGRLFAVANGYDASPNRWVVAFTTSAGIPTPVAGNPFPNPQLQPTHGLLHPAGYYLTTARMSSDVGVFHISGSGSSTALTAVAGSPFPTWGSSGGTDTTSVVDSTGRFIVTSNGDTRNLTLFGFNPTTGALTHLQTTPTGSQGTTGSINGLAFAPFIGGPPKFDVLHAFAGADGSVPESLIRAADGNFYGTTLSGGDFNQGTAFRMTSDGAVTVLHSFNSATDGFDSPRTLMQAIDGSFFGTANHAIFTMTTSGAVGLVHAFSSDESPHHLVQTQFGHLYGLLTIHPSWAVFPGGSVFLVTAGSGISTLITFGVESDTGSDLVDGGDGTLYVTTLRGPTSSFQADTVLRLSGGGYTIVHQFTGPEGTVPTNLLRSADGNLYGTTGAGSTFNHGAVFKLTLGGTLTVLHALAASVGNYLRAFIEGADGSFYGTIGYYSNPGIVFKLTHTGATFSVLHTFTGGAAGSYPNDGLLHAPDGNLYGTTNLGGISNNGVVYRLSSLPGTLTGHVRDASTNAPIAGAQVTTNPGGASVVTDASGSYSQELTAGTYTLTVTAPLYTSASIPGIVVVNAQTTTEDVGLAQIGGSITGHVRDAATNAPIQNALVGISPGGFSTTTNASGLYAQFVPPGTYTLTASAANYATVSVSGIAVANGETKTQDVALQRVANTLSGHVRSAATNAPIDHAQVTINPGGFSAVTDEAGLYSRIVPLGTYTVSAVALDYRQATASGVVVGASAPTTQDFVLVPLGAVSGDFDADHKADITVFRPSTGAWHVLKSSTNNSSSQSFSWGLSTDTPVPADYDGDRTIDPAVYRPSTGGWYVLKSSTNYTTSLSLSWGLSTDVPVPADYDGDGKADPAIYRPSTGGWHILMSSTNYTTSLNLSWGLSTDVPLQGDYDGDGKADPTVFRPSTGGWHVLKSSTNYTTSLNFSWGLSTDIPVPGDYDGDGKVDPAVSRPSTGGWHILMSSTNYTTSLSFSWGVSTDVPVPGDFDGDGKTDPAIYRPSTGLWAILQSSTSYTTSIVVSWGLSTDTPILKRP